MCFDLHDGTFECACNKGYVLEPNGYSCVGESPLCFGSGVDRPALFVKRHILIAMTH